MSMRVADSPSSLLSPNLRIILHLKKKATHRAIAILSMCLKPISKPCRRRKARRAARLVRGVPRARHHRTSGSRPRTAVTSTLQTHLQHRMHPYKQISLEDHLLQMQLADTTRILWCPPASTPSSSQARRLSLNNNHQTNQIQ